MKVLLEKGADIDQCDSSGNSCIHIAAVGQKLNTLNYLIKKKADLCIRNKSNKSGLQFAMKYLPSTTVEALKDRFDRSIEIMQDDDYKRVDSEVRLDFDLFLPPISKPNSTSEMALIQELISYRKINGVNHNNSENIKHLLIHPLTQSYLYLKWSKIWVFYYGLLLAHLIYSLVYSAYALIFYHNLCPGDYGENPIKCQKIDFTSIKEDDIDTVRWYYGMLDLNSITYFSLTFSLIL